MTATFLRTVNNRADNFAGVDVPDPADLIERYGDYLFRFALSRLRDDSAAEDLVQETLLAALKKIHTFSGKSSLRTWLTSILKNKIGDYFRKLGREELFDCSDSANEEYFQPDGSWKPQFVPSAWSQTPATTVENREFWEIINRGLAGLSKKTALAFILHQIEGMPAEEICRTLSITRSNLWVMLHRARLFMQNQLEHGFFGD
ncbi:MAG: sigma-70 family RNA polymerase sigma factor [Pyrinomonadaceae bacterium]